MLFVLAVGVGGVTPRALRWRSGNGRAARVTGGGGSTARMPRPSQLRFCACFGGVRGAGATGGDEVDRLTCDASKKKTALSALDHIRVL